jgi:hypothetical protein
LEAGNTPPVVHLKEILEEQFICRTIFTEQVEELQEQVEQHPGGSGQEEDQEEQVQQIQFQSPVLTQVEEVEVDLLEEFIRCTRWNRRWRSRR